MLYAILCYNSEEIVGSWTKEEDDAVMTRLGVVHDRLTSERKLGPAVRLKGTRNATTVRKTGQGRRLEPGREPPAVIDGPYAETKEQMLGFYIIDVAGQDEAVEVAVSSPRPIPVAPTSSVRCPCTCPARPWAEARVDAAQHGDCNGFSKWRRAPRLALSKARPMRSIARPFPPEVAVTLGGEGIMSVCSRHAEAIPARPRRYRFHNDPRRRLSPVGKWR